MSDISGIIEKVKKLLALSTSSNVHEATVATAAANKLIDAYRLSQADLETQTEACEPVEEDQGYLYQTGRIIPWKDHLASVLIRHYGLACWNDAEYKTTGRRVSRYRLVGRKSDIAIVKYMFLWLATECARLCDVEAKGKGRIYCQSYCEGFVSGIASQLKSSRQEMEKQASETAIIKINARAQEAEQAMYQLHDNLHKVKSSSKSHYDSDGYQAGKNKGTSFHLGNSLSASGTKLLGN